MRNRSLTLKASVPLLTGCVALGLALPPAVCRGAMPEAPALVEEAETEAEPGLAVGELEPAYEDLFEVV